MRPVNRQRKRCPTSFVISEMRIKPTRRSHFTLPNSHSMQRLFHLWSLTGRWQAASGLEANWHQTTTETLLTNLTRGTHKTWSQQVHESAVANPILKGQYPHSILYHVSMANFPASQPKSQYNPLICLLKKVKP